MIVSISGDVKFGVRVKIYSTQGQSLTALEYFYSDPGYI